MLPSAFDKAKLFTEKYFKNSNLVDSSLKLHNISVTPRMVKKVITNLDLSKVFVLIVFSGCSKELVA